MDELQTFGVALIQALQVLSPTLDDFMALISFLGTIDFYMLFLTFLYWNVSTSAGFRVFLVLLATDVPGTALKHLLRQPRPYWVDNRIIPLSTETSYGIPSTHASDSLSVWGMLAANLKKNWLWITAAGLVLLIGLSRLYLGVHFPHDVLGGWLLGLGILLLFFWSEKRMRPWLANQASISLIGLALLISILIPALGFLVRGVTAGSPDPSAWAAYAAAARPVTHYFTLAGAFFGAVSGYVLMKKYAPVKTSGSWTRKAGRYLVGIAGVFLILQGLDILFSQIAADETGLGYVLRYLRYGGTTFWAMGGAPWFFLRLKLADRA